MLGPLDSPLNMHLEATYGYFALELAAYDEYVEAMARNPKLRDGLNVSRYLNLEERRIDSNPTVLPRAYFPKTVVDVAGSADSLRALETLGPAARAIVLGSHPPIRQDPAATAAITAHDERTMRIRYRVAQPSLLVLSVPWFPGWRATAGTDNLPIMRVNHALIGLIVPADRQELEVGFRSTYFAPALAMSLAGLLGALALFVWSPRRVD
jgi:hypothetical protein